MVAAVLGVYVKRRVEGIGGGRVEAGQRPAAGAPCAVGGGGGRRGIRRRRRRGFRGFSKFSDRREDGAAIASVLRGCRAEVHVDRLVHARRRPRRDSPEESQGAGDVHAAVRAPSGRVDPRRRFWHPGGSPTELATIGLPVGRRRLAGEQRPPLALDRKRPDVVQHPSVRAAPAVDHHARALVRDAKARGGRRVQLARGDDDDGVSEPTGRPRDVVRIFASTFTRLAPAPPAASPARRRPRAGRRRRPGRRTTTRRVPRARVHVVPPHVVEHAALVAPAEDPNLAALTPVRLIIALVVALEVGGSYPVVVRGAGL